MNRALSTRVRTLERKAGVTDLSRLSDADLDARMRDLSARNAPTFGAGCGSSKAGAGRVVVPCSCGRGARAMPILSARLRTFAPGLTIS